MFRANHHVEISCVDRAVETAIRRLMVATPEVISALTQNSTDQPPRSVQYGVCFCMPHAGDAALIKQAVEASDWLRTLREQHSGSEINVVVWNSA